MFLESFFPITPTKHKKPDKKFKKQNDAVEDDHFSESIGPDPLGHIGCAMYELHFNDQSPFNNSAFIPSKKQNCVLTTFLFLFHSLLLLLFWIIRY